MWGAGSQHPLRRVLVQHVQASGVGFADMHQRFQEAPQQFFEIPRFQLNAKKFVKRRRFGLADLIVGVVQRQDDAKMQLLANPLEVGVFDPGSSDTSAAGMQQLVVLLQSLKDRAGRQTNFAKRRPLYSTVSIEMQRAPYPAKGYATRLPA